ncbi:hypothetical protein J5N97_015049 [Dioscorea zingiberensis]|uniref:MPN domain-containing protein n=1 Tax=Dioscorea zingiberensis TaxID=325984 RepID=A0A9D5HK35_9LILI|nr:hypothetical protein J5N97_015049 [Dioscorea zingiberensis]
MAMRRFRRIDGPLPDSSEKICISPLAVCKMLKHGAPPFFFLYIRSDLGFLASSCRRVVLSSWWNDSAKARVPMEVMGLVLGEFVDEYTIRVADVFAMPHRAAGVIFEIIDRAFQSKMLNMLREPTALILLYRHEMVVGWYCSHPRFGCGLYGRDTIIQQHFQGLHPRAIAVVVDPIQSVNGKVVIDAFRNVTPGLDPGLEPRQTTSNAYVGRLNKPSKKAESNGLNKLYYSILINFRINELEEKMLLNLLKKKWSDGLRLEPFDIHSKTNEQRVQVGDEQKMVDLTNKYNKAIQ